MGPDEHMPFPSGSTPKCGRQHAGVHAGVWPTSTSPRTVAAAATAPSAPRSPGDHPAWRNRAASFRSVIRQSQARHHCPNLKRRITVAIHRISETSLRGAWQGGAHPGHSWDPEFRPVVGGRGEGAGRPRQVHHVRPERLLRSGRPEPFETVDLSDHVDDAAALLVALSATPAVVIGRSTGGEMALAPRAPLSQQGEGSRPPGGCGVHR